MQYIYILPSPNSYTAYSLLTQSMVLAFLLLSSMFVSYLAIDTNRLLASSGGDEDGGGDNGGDGGQGSEADNSGDANNNGGQPDTATEPQGETSPETTVQPEQTELPEQQPTSEICDNGVDDDGDGKIDSDDSDCQGKKGFYNKDAGGIACEIITLGHGCIPFKPSNVPKPPQPPQDPGLEGPGEPPVPSTGSGQQVPDCNDPKNKQDPYCVGTPLPPGQGRADLDANTPQNLEEGQVLKFGDLVPPGDKTNPDNPLPTQTPGPTQTPTTPPPTPTQSQSQSQPTKIIVKGGTFTVPGRSGGSSSSPSPATTTAPTSADCSPKESTLTLGPSVLQNGEAKLILILDPCSLVEGSLVLNLPEGGEGIKLLAANLQGNQATQSVIVPLHRVAPIGTGQTLYDVDLNNLVTGEEPVTGKQVTLNGNINALLLWNNAEKEVGFSPQNSVALNTIVK